MDKPVDKKAPKAVSPAEGESSLQKWVVLNTATSTETSPALQAKIAYIAARCAVPAAIIAAHVAANWRGA
jgi:hypothetical protein